MIVTNTVYSDSFQLGLLVKEATMCALVVFSPIHFEAAEMLSFFQTRKNKGKTETRVNTDTQAKM